MCSQRLPSSHEEATQTASPDILLPGGNCEPMSCVFYCMSRSAALQDVCCWNLLEHLRSCLNTKSWVKQAAAKMPMLGDGVADCGAIIEHDQELSVAEGKLLHTGPVLSSAG